MSRVVIRKDASEIDPNMPSWTLADGTIIQIPIAQVHADAKHWDELYPDPLGKHGLDQHPSVKDAYSVEQWEHDREIEAFMHAHGAGKK